MSVFCFNDDKEKVELKVMEGTATVPIGEAAQVKRQELVIGGSIDFRKYAILSVMSGHGDDIGDTNNEGNPITPTKVINGVVYPSAEFELYNSQGTGNKNKVIINLYNDTSGTSTKMWYRLVLIKVDED